MKMKKLFQFLILILATGIIGSCVKQDFDRPPIVSIPVGQVYTIGELIEMYNTTGATQFNTDASVYGVVTMDEVSGNIYKSSYIQDATGAINLRLKESGGLRVGDSVRIYLKNVILSEYNKMRQLDNVHNDSNIIILANGKYREPETVTISQILSGNYQAKLIKLDNVQFIAGDTAFTYASADAATSRLIEDCDGKTIVVRTSNFASFQKNNIPNGNGSMIAVASLFNTTWQLYIRSANEVNLTGNRCGTGGGGGDDPVDGVNEEFASATNNTDIAIQGWTNIAEAGNRKWQGKVFSGDGYAQASGYNSNLQSMVTWLITPNVKMDVPKKLRFKTAKAFWEHGSNVPMTVLVSSNFDGVNVAAASWTPITAKIAGQSDADNAWVESGDIDLSAFMPEGKIAVAFKYVGSGTQSTSMRVDNVYIGTQSGGGGGGGNGGTIDEPFTIEQAIESQNANPYVVGWIKGYIVGSVKSGTSSVESSADIHWSAPFTSATNVLLASSATETDYTKCVIVNMSAGTEFRTAVNLLDNPGNLGKQLKATGTLRTYFGVAGLRDCPGTAADFVLEGGGGGGGGNDPVEMVNEDFQSVVNNTDIAFSGWVNIAEAGTRKWQGKVFSGDGYAQSTGYNSNLPSMITWLVTPNVKMDVAKKLRFRTAKSYWAHGSDVPMTVLVSTNYDGINPSAATWTPITVTLAGQSDADNAWVESGDIDLSAYIPQGKIAVAFKYVGSGTQSTTMRVDNVFIGL